MLLSCSREKPAPASLCPQYSKSRAMKKGTVSSGLLLRGAGAEGGTNDRKLARLPAYER